MCCSAAEVKVGPSNSQYSCMIKGTVAMRLAYVVISVYIIAALLLEVSCCDFRMLNTQIKE